jgi:hypothetical protein
MSTVRKLSENWIQDQPKPAKRESRKRLIFLYFVVSSRLVWRASLRYEPEGREFESPRARHLFNYLQQSEDLRSFCCGDFCGNWPQKY